MAGHTSESALWEMPGPSERPRMRLRLSKSTHASRGACAFAAGTSAAKTEFCSLPMRASASCSHFSALKSLQTAQADMSDLSVLEQASTFQVCAFDLTFSAVTSRVCADTPQLNIALYSSDTKSVLIKMRIGPALADSPSQPPKTPLPQL